MFTILIGWNKEEWRNEEAHHSPFGVLYRPLFNHINIAIVSTATVGTLLKNKAKHISRVSDQKGVSLLYIMLEIHRSDREPSTWSFVSTTMPSSAETGNYRTNGRKSQEHTCSRSRTRGCTQVM